MTPISTHLHLKPFQVASTTDVFLDFRKWNHLGTFHAVDHKQAAFDAYKGNGTYVGEFNGPQGTGFRFSCGTIINVKF